MEYKVDFSSIPWESPLPGARFKARREGGKQLRFVEFSQELVEPDWCRKAHVGYVLEGQLEIDFSGRVVVFNPGDGLLIPLGEEHKHMARVPSGTVKMILIEDI
jgi:quercetin dioxygenase-like cupin family protein